MPTTDLPESESESVADKPTVAYPVLPIPDGVIFPEMVITVTMQSEEARRLLDDTTDNTAGSADDGRAATLLLVPKTDDKYAKVGVTATVVSRDRLPRSNARRHAASPPPCHRRIRRDRPHRRSVGRSHRRSRCHPQPV